MRLLASLEHYVLLSDDDSVTVHQYVAGRYTAGLAHGEVEFEVQTDYPWDGEITVTVRSGPEIGWTLALRVPAWAAGARLQVNGEDVTEQPSDGWWRVERTWRSGDEVRLTLPLEPRLTAGDPRLDATRGCVAIERGPLVYCLEGVDHDGHRLDDLVLDPAVPLSSSVEDDQLGRVVRVQATGRTRPHAVRSWWPYQPAAADDAAPAGAELTLRAVPYFTWGNRGPGAMRVWVPTDGS